MPYIPNTVISQASASGLVLIEDELLGADAASIDFSGISGAYKHLRIVAQWRGAGAGAGAVQMRFNGDSGANYAYQFVQGQGNSGSAINQAQVSATAALVSALVSSGVAAGIANAVAIDIPNYAATAFHKSYTSQASAATGTLQAEQFSHTFAGRWSSTAAITQITVLPDSGNFLAGSRATLYGLT